jgi:hypothetical protein
MLLLATKFILLLLSFTVDNLEQFYTALHIQDKCKAWIYSTCAK